jgi:branched-chain amino acid transport system permease protein
MNLPVQLAINALQVGAVYVVFALGLTLIFGVMRIINFAHGEFFTLTGLSVSTLMPNVTSALGLPGWASYGLCFLAALVIVAALAWLTYIGVMSRFVQDTIGALIVTLGLVMQSLFIWGFGNFPRRVPALVPGVTDLMGGRVSNDRLIIFGLAILLTVLLWQFLKHTKSGIALRAVADDREAAQLQGIDDRRIIMLGFVVGSILAALAGGLIAPTTVLSPTIGADYLTKAFIIIIIGGTGSVPGAIIGGFVVGAIESVAGFYLDSTAALILLFVGVSAILLVRPQGLLGNATR